MGSLWKDLRYALRVLAKSPGFSLVVIMSLALAIGANTAIYGIFSALLFRPMPVEDPGRLIAIYQTAPNAGANVAGFSYPEWQDFSAQDTGLTAIVGSGGLPLSITEADQPELIWGEVVTGNYFSGLGVPFAAGRGFLPDENRNPGEKPVCVLNYNFWQRRYAGDPKIVGKTIRIENHEFAIVGVAGRGFIGTGLFEFVPDLWIPAMMQQTIWSGPGDPLHDRADRWMNVRGRLKPGVTEKQAEAALNVVARRLAKEYPKTDSDLTVHVLPGGARTMPMLVATNLIPMTTVILGGLVLLVLLIACANVANLMLARGTSRTREMAVRIAIGATRWKLVRQLLTESVLLSLAGGVGGILFAVWFSDLTLRFYPKLDFQTMDVSQFARVDPKIFLVAFAISMVSAVLFGLFPAWRASKVDQQSAIRGENAAGGRFGPGNVLVMVQVALSCVLLISGGLFLRSMRFAQNSDVGFRRTGISMFSLNLALQGYDDARAAVFERTLIERLRAISGVEDAAFAFPLPLDTYGSPGPVYPEGWQPRSDSEQNIAGHSRVSSGYFKTMGSQIIAGRAIDDRDRKDTTRAAVVNETMAARYWGSAERALGRKFSESKNGPEFEVVGVAQNGTYLLFGEPAYSYYFSPASQDSPWMIEVLIRTRRDLGSLMPQVRDEVHKLDPELPVFGVRTMPQFLFRTVSMYELLASLVGTFAAIALLLAAVGLYGVLHFVVTRRTREIGIRMALGARYEQVLKMVLSKSLAWVGAGLAAGIGLALLSKNVTGQLVAGVSGGDPLTFAAAIAIFLAIVVAACVIPARRAARVDPIQALRHE